MLIRRHLLASALALALSLPSTASHAEPFTFQGFLEQSGAPLNGTANLAFKLYDAQSGGNQLGTTITANSYPVLHGVFSIDLNFTGVAFADANRWLQVEVGGTPMGPRIEILPAPVAASARALQGRGVSATAPSNGQVLKWNGSAWAPAADAAGATYTAGPGLVLNGTEFSANLAGSGAANSVARSDHGHYGQVFTGSSALQGLNISQGNSAGGSTALFAIAQAASGVTVGVAGVTNSSTGSARGVFGHATAGSGDVWGVYGRTDSSGGRGVYGHATATSGNNWGVHGQTDSAGLGARGVFGHATATSGDVYGVHGRTDSPQGRGVFGLASANTGFAPGVIGETLSASAGARGVYGLAMASSGDTFGVYGRANSNSGTGVLGEATAANGVTVGVRGLSASNGGTGVRGEVSAASGATIGVHGSSASSGGTGVRGEGETGVVAQGQSLGLDGAASDTAGQAVGVRGSSGSADGAGVFAINSATSGNAYGAYAQTNSTAGAALVGDALATSGANRGVLARTASGGGVGLRAENTGTAGLATALEAIGGSNGGTTSVFQANGAGSSWAIDASSAGPTGRALNARLTNNSATGAAVYAQVNASGARAVQGVNLAGGLAGDFTGNVAVSGTLSKGGGSFKIDHPLDPANKYLLHSFVESPDMMNIYNGNIVTDAQGRATIELPEWFEALNRDFRYQLTVIGEFAQAVVSRKVEQNRFEIRTSSPKVEVSWQVTGIRQDAWAEQNRIPVELDKAAAEKGRFLHPEAHGLPASKRIGAGGEGKE